MTQPQLQQQPPMVSPLSARLNELRHEHRRLTDELAMVDRERTRLHAALLRLEGGISALDEYAQHLAEGR